MHPRIKGEDTGDRHFCVRIVHRRARYKFIYRCALLPQFLLLGAVIGEIVVPKLSGYDGLHTAERIVGRLPQIIVSACTPIKLVLYLF